MTAQAATRGKAYFIGGDPTVTIGAEPQDLRAVALDRLLGVRAEQIERATEAEVFSDRTRTKLWLAERRNVKMHREYSSLRAESFGEILQACDEANASWPVGRAREAQTSADFANLLGNTLGRRLLAAYAEAEFGERSLMRPGSAQSLRDQRVVAIDGAADVPTVNPESVDYVELTTLAERVISFSMLQKGVIVSITRKVVTNNDVDVVTRLIDELGRAARRTLARAVWALWSSNATYAPDGLAWFHASHSNLQSTAISEAEVIAAVRKLLDQTQPGAAAEKMGTRVRPGSLWLTVPNALWDAAMKLNQTTGSALYHLFGVENENIIVNPLLTDANDWGVHRDSREVESVRVDFLMGREDPEFALSDLPNAANMFQSDKIRYRLRHEYGVALAEFRGAVKAVVP